KRPSNGRTEIRGNVVTCRLIDAVGDFNRSMATPRTPDSVRGVEQLTQADYKRDVAAAGVGLPRQRVRSVLSIHDPDTDVATEIFTLEPLLQKGRPRSLAGGSR
ncbi:MAG: hypothetical protein ACXWZM_06040, partial [Solirubrobacterales bacterium]